MNNRFTLLLLLLLSLVVACSQPDNDFNKDTDRASLHLLFGNPSNATANPLNEDNYLITLPQYSTSYNRSKGIPNWVSWHLSDDWLGSVSRQEDFRVYDNLPEGWYRVRPDDYNFSFNGFDRGHNCPSADRTLTDVDNSATFYMINIMPQAPAHNQNVWAALENYCRRLVRQGNELYIIMGQYGVGGTGNKGYRENIADGKVTVPRHFWKVIVVLPKGDNDLQRIDEQTRVIAVSIENRNALGGRPWSEFRTTVNEIEAAAGIDLLSELPITLQAVLESRVDNVVIP